MPWFYDIALRALRAALVLTISLWLAPARAPAAPTALPPQGVYEGCAPATSPDGCNSRLRALGASGFRVVVNGAMLRGTAEQALTYADTARAAGVQVIWPLNALFSPETDLAGPVGGSLAATCGCTDNQGLLAYVVALARSRSNTWGYYIADEPKPAAHDRVKDLAARVKALDPGHPGIVMGCGICYGGDPTGANISFLADIDATLGTDAYPIFNQPADSRDAYDRVAMNAGSLRSVADRAGRQTVVTLQAWRWGDSVYDVPKSDGVNPIPTRFPTRAEIEMQRNAAIERARPSLILWFKLEDVIGYEPGQRPWYWAEPSDPQQRWANLVQGAFAPLPGAGTPTVPSSAAAGPPIARFTMRPGRAVRLGSTVVVDARGSQARGGRIVKYRWSVSGGALRCRLSRCTFRAARRGTHRVTLSVFDSAGRTARSTLRLRVRRGR